MQELFREIAVRLPKDSEESVGWNFSTQKAYGFVGGVLNDVEYEWGMGLVMLGFMISLM